MVLIVTVVLATLAVELTFSSRINAKITTNLRDSTKAYYLAKSGISMGAQRIVMDSVAHQLLGKYIGNSDNLTEFWWTIPLMYPLGAGMFSDVLEESGLSQDALKNFEKSQDIGGSFISEISDESSRINVNDIQFTAETPNGVYTVLMNLMTMPKFQKFFRYKSREEILNKIVDWVDVNSEIAGIGGGIEDSDYYDYRVKNAAFFSPGELKLVKGVTLDFYTELEPFITVFPFSYPQSTVPLSKINVNTAPREIIASLFDQGFVSDPWQVSKEIMEERDGGIVWNSKDEYIKYIQDKLGIDPKDKEQPISRSIENIIGVKSDYFRLKSTGIVENSQSTITAVAKRQGREYSIIYWRDI